jgi:hypothetical protein
MRARFAATLCILVALAAGAVGLGAGIYGLDRATQNSAELSTAVSDLRLLLLDGKTASAKSARLTAHEVQLLVGQSSFDHTQSVNGQKELQVTIHVVERHLDRTIRRAVNHAAARTVRKLK